ncbi:tripartite tricarboxylate transporter TctB family protein [Aureimonas populi]|uniref:Tripartite tricarboxylate transporter TctB family protein n=1 Tax=Aureimonas populi TaxID=1701758 RepID=A0ABW5CHM5_9HYPH|nr:tripartite tricarboxylate transporter TctB family protein [Aureimonas populi]
MHSSTHTKSQRDIIAGGIFLAIAATFGFISLGYEMGTPLRMGPGFIPLTLAIILAILGVVIIVSGIRKNETVETSPVSWTGSALVVASLVIFGVFARQLGLVPIVFLCTALTAFASRNNTLLSALTIAAAMSILCYLIFKIGLGITLPTFGPLFAL